MENSVGHTFLSKHKVRPKTSLHIKQKYSVILNGLNIYTKKTKQILRQTISFVSDYIDPHMYSTQNKSFFPKVANTVPGEKVLTIFFIPL